MSCVARLCPLAVAFLLLTSGLAGILYVADDALHDPNGRSAQLMSAVSELMPLFVRDAVHDKLEAMGVDDSEGAAAVRERLALSRARGTVGASAKGRPVVAGAAKGCRTGEAPSSRGSLKRWPSHDSREGFRSSSLESGVPTLRRTIMAPRGLS